MIEYERPKNINTKQSRILRRALIDKRILVRELARIVGMSVAEISEIRHGHRIIKDPVMLKKFEEALGVESFSNAHKCPVLDRENSDGKNIVERLKEIRDSGEPMDDARITELSREFNPAISKSRIHHYYKALDYVGCREKFNTATKGKIISYDEDRSIILK